VNTRGAAPSYRPRFAISIRDFDPPQTVVEFPANGFHLVEEFDELPWQPTFFRDNAP
jgi:hypothetical protein